MQQSCKDLKDNGIIESNRVGRESLISLNLRVFVTEIFKIKKSRRNPEKQDWKVLIAWMTGRLKRAKESLKEAKRLVRVGYHGRFLNPETQHEIYKSEVCKLEKQLELLRKDAEEARALEVTSAASLNEHEITFLIKRLDTGRIKTLCNKLKETGVLDYIRGESNIVNIFIALIIHYGFNVDNPIESHERMLSLLGLKNINTTPITDAVIQSFLWRSGRRDVIEFYDRFYIDRPRDVVVIPKPGN